MKGNRKLIIFFSSLVLLSLPSVILAAAVDPNTWIRTVFDNFLRIVLWPIFIGAILIMLIFAGFMFVTSNGDPAKISTAKKAVIFAIVGTVVGILAYSAVSFIRRIVGV